MAEKWYDKSVKQTETWLKTDSSKGLDRDEVIKRRRLDGNNDIYPTPKKSFLNYLRHLLTDYTSVLLLITLLISAVFDEADNLPVMLLILVTYYAIVIFTYVRSQRIIEGLGTYALPNVKVLREGRLYMVKQKQLVRGDVIYVSTGDIVPCDARLVESDGLEVLEVNVTSVAHAVRKDASFVDYHDISPAQQKNMIFASSIVTRGTAKAVCCETGADTLVCVMKKNEPIMSNERLIVLDSIGRFCRSWTLVMTLIVMALTVCDIIVSNGAPGGLLGSFLTGLSLAVASMSEFYSAFAYIVLACGIFSAVNRKKDVNTGALIKNTDKLGDIKNLTTLIVPRRAAFSVRDMRVGKVFANGDSFAPGEHGYRRNAGRVLRYALLSTGLYGAGRLTENNRRGDNIYTAEEEAIISAAEKCGEYNIGLEERYPMLRHIGKCAECRFETTLVRYENGFVVSLRGEYTQVLPICRYYTEDSRVYEMTPEKRSEFLVAAEKLSRESYRVIAVASKDTIYNNLSRLSACQSDMTFEGFVAVREPTLPDAAKNVLRCQNAGIRVIMLCPDVSENNAIAAETLGIAKERGQIITGQELATLKEGLFRANLGIYTVYEGLNLAQKRLLVRFLQESGEKVGYLCSELDEIILMKEADVGFSESITISDRAGTAGIDLSGRKIPVYTKTADGANGSGCEALKFVSDVIVSEADKNGTGGFNAIVDSVICAKSIYYNLHRMLKYMIASQVAKLFIVFVSVFLGVTALTPPEILFCGLVVDFAALIIIAFERSGTTLLKMPSHITEKLTKPLTRNIGYIVIGLFWAAVTLAAAFYMKGIGLITDEAFPTCCFLSFILTQIAMLNECKREQSIFDRNVKINGAYLALLAVVVSFAVLLFLSPGFGALFSVTVIPAEAYIGIAAVPVLITLCCELYKLINLKVSDTPKKPKAGIFDTDEE